MGKFCVFSGFLGSGKTTTMMALTKYWSQRYGKAAMISNDLGHGVTLADDRLARLSGLNASEITEDCICYRNETLAEYLDRYFAEGCTLVLSDIPGFGVGALEHVYHGLREKYPGVYDLAPFTVMVEPKTVERLQSGGGDLGYILHTQLMEADLIVLNKTDTITEAKKAESLAWLKARYPLAECVSLSARTGEGMENLCTALRDSSTSLRRPDIGYGGEAFLAAMGRFSEYYLQYRAVVCCKDFDGNAYLRAMAQAVRERVRRAGCEIPHLKLLAWEPEGDFGKVDLIGSDRETECPHAFSKPVKDIAVILNASAVCPAEKLQELLRSAAEGVSAAFQLEMTVFREECFGMG